MFRSQREQYLRAELQLMDELAHLETQRWLQAEVMPLRDAVAADMVEQKAS